MILQLKLIKVEVLLMLLAVVSVGKAQYQQTWPMQGAEWTYCLYTELGDCYACETWRVTNDSVIETRKYNIIQPVDSFGFAVPNSGKMLLTRFANDTVYRFVNGREYVFFIFNINEGDIFTTFRSAGWGANGVPNYGNDSTCSATKPILVTEKKRTELGGIVLNEYVLKDTLFTTLYDFEAQHMWWKMVDRIGPIDTYPLIDLNETGFYDTQSGFCSYATCNSYAELSAYRDDDFEQVWYICQPTSIEENSLDDRMSIYPNPATCLVHIESGEINEIQIYNAFGQKVETFQWTNEINVKNLPKGIYMLLIIDMNNTKRIKKLIIE